jgi:hypothetical protein
MAEGEGATVTLTEAELNENRGYVLDAISVSFALLTTIVLGLRFYAKRFSAATYGLDDVFLTAAYVVNLGMCAIGLGMSCSVAQVLIFFFLLSFISFFFISSPTLEIL